jgi:hypothetical protein
MLITYCSNLHQSSKVTRYVLRMHKTVEIKVVLTLFVVDGRIPDPDSIRTDNYEYGSASLKYLRIRNSDFDNSLVTLFFY